MRILVVEDDRILGEAISQRISRMGHGLDLAQTGLQANHMLAVQEYDLMLLDLNLPDITGHQILQILRKKHSNTPVIVLTARDEMKDRIELLDLGADDYMTKPVDFGELEARCRALLRRSQGQAHNTIEYGNVSLDLQSCSVMVDGHLIELKQREFRLLEVLMSHTGRVLSKEALIEHIYNFNENPNPSVIEIYMTRLRKSLQNSDLQIRTIRGLGYLLEKYHG
ncbi:response regulator transcription factor [Marinomonas foliarum]|uniref:Winged helix family two component transcriptional regulator n=1 Tax=Marinomonas foliarum TaxID=491950 RepID=A0A368ZPN6_9GAMM|nr:response regulator transcription factor [Marinomonas foliarum]RCW97944.1 winged helix family two component transcriptional regulator [Marinomonas foliarum]